MFQRVPVRDEKGVNIEIAPSAERCHMAQTGALTCFHDGRHASASIDTRINKTPWCRKKPIALSPGATAYQNYTTLSAKVRNVFVFIFTPHGLVFSAQWYLVGEILHTLGSAPSPPPFPVLFSSQSDKAVEGVILCFVPVVFSGS